MNALEIDSFEFSRRSEQRSGKVEVATLPRLAAETTDGSGTLAWVLQGGKDPHGYLQLSLGVQGTVKLACQRCLTPLEFPIDAKSTLILASNEQVADELDELLAEDEAEVVVASDPLQILALVEDESLLALPVAPKHLVCPDKADIPAPRQQEKISPFAVLKNLKR